MRVRKTITCQLYHSTGIRRYLLSEMLKVQETHV